MLATEETKATTSTRLVIKEIHVDNFKSYAGQHIIGPLHKTFTAIIGPNGSGKSNVIDSLLFVFAKNAKKIRLEKLSELIHNSAAHPNLAYASVTVQFCEIREMLMMTDEEERERKEGDEDSSCPHLTSQQQENREGEGGTTTSNPRHRQKNKNKNPTTTATTTTAHHHNNLMDVDSFVEVRNSSFSITRKVWRNNQSQYYINDAKCTQKDVVNLLIGKGVDLEHNRFLILQGEVEQIALMKPKGEKEGEEGLVEYFDDLVGTNRYVAEITERVKIAEDCAEEKQSCLDVLKRVEKERNELETAKNQTIDYVSKDNHMQKLLSIMCQIKKAEVDKNLKEPRARIEALSQKIREQEVDMKEEKKQMSDKENQLKQHQKAYEKAKEKLEKIQTEKVDAEMKLTEVKAGNDETEKQRKKDQEKLKKIDEEMKKWVLEQENGERNLKLAESHHAEALKACEELEPQYEKETEAMQAELMPLRKKQEVKEREIAPFRTRVTEAEEDVMNIKEEMKMSTGTLERMKQDILHFTQEKEEKELKRTQLKSILAQEETKRKIFDDEEALDGEFKDRRRQLERERSAIVTKKFTFNNRISTIKEELKYGEQDDKVVSFLLTKNIPGYFGTLRQLGRIDAKYDMAAGVGGGPSWGYHVVDTSATASLVIRTLKESNVGRADCIVLEQQMKLLENRMDRKFQSPSPQAQRLFDLIKPMEGKFAVAFYFAVKDTLVVEELSKARELGLGDKGQRFRTVTLHGELVEPSGNISGGGMPRPAKLNAAHAPTDKMKAREELKQLQLQLMATIEKEKELEACIEQENRSRARSMSGEQNSASFSHKPLTPEQVRQISTQVRSLDLQLTSLEEKISETMKEIKKAEAKLGTISQELEKKYLNAEKKLEKERKALLHIELAIDELKKEQENCGGAAYQQLKTELEAAKKQQKEQDVKIQEAKKAVSKAQVSMERKKKEEAQILDRIEKLNASLLDSHQDEIQKLSKKVEDIAGQVRVHVQATHQELANIDDMTKEITHCQERLRQMTKELDSLERDKKTLEESMGEQLEALEKYQRKINECEAKIKHNVGDFGLETLQLDEVVGKRRGDDNVLLDEEEGDNETNNSSPSRERSGSSPNSRSQQQKVNHKRKRGHPGDRRRHELQKDFGIPEDFNFERDYTTIVHPAEDLGKWEFEHVKRIAHELHTDMTRVKEKIDFQVVGRWKEKDDQYKQQRQDYEEIMEKANRAEQELEALKLKRKTEFMNYFRSIQMKLKEMYQLLTNGGDAEIELVDTLDPFEGINFIVRPPRKSWKQVSNLSGGEKTLSSLALVFALHHVRPTPIYVMDEIDAALDFRNVSIVARYILERAIGAQFIIISLRNNMFELAHQLVGICKVNDCTRSVGLNPRFITEKIKKNAVMHDRQAQQSQLRMSQGDALRSSQRGGPQTGLGQVSMMMQSPEQKLIAQAIDQTGTRLSQTALLHHAQAVHQQNVLNENLARLSGQQHPEPASLQQQASSALRPRDSNEMVLRGPAGKRQTQSSVMVDGVTSRQQHRGNNNDTNDNEDDEQEVTDSHDMLASLESDVRHSNHTEVVVERQAAKRPVSKKSRRGR